MRIPLSLLATLALGACSAPAQAAWQKPGADPQAVDRDTATCRAAARAEALRQHPYSAGAGGAGGAVMSQQRDDTDRATVEAARFNECMTGRGYKRG